MTAHPGATAAPPASEPSPDVTRLSQEGMVAGLLGAATIAVWFLLLDALAGRPL